MTPTQTSAPRRGRRLLAGISAIAVASLLSACAVFSPMSTNLVYNPGDGVALTLGDVAVRDLVVVGTEEGEPATIAAYVVNNSGEDVTVTFSTEGSAPATLNVPASSAVQASPAGEEGLTIESLAVPLGAIVPMTVQVDGNAPAQVGVPTVSASETMYSEYAPGG